MSQFQPQQPPWQQPQTYYPPQQPPNQLSSYPQQQQWEPPAQPYPPQYPPQMPPQQQWQQQTQYGPPPPPPVPPKKSHKLLRNKWFWIAVVIFIVISGIVSALSGGNSSTTTTSNTAQPTATQPAQHATTPAKPTQAPKPTQVPTQSPAQAEQAYKASATNTTVAVLDKDGNNDQGNTVHFTATIANFVKDDTGNTAGANVTDANYSSFIQVRFPAGTDLSQLNKGDTLEVWGMDNGTFSGTNAFGATIQEVEVDATYMTDQTTGYHAG